MGDDKSEIARIAAEMAQLAGDVDRLRADVARLAQHAASLGLDLSATSDHVESVRHAVGDLRTRVSLEQDRVLAVRSSTLLFVVDRDDAVQSLAREYLGNAGFTVRSFSSAEHVVDQLSIEIPRAALIDLTIPGMAAATLAEYLRTSPRTSRVCRMAMTPYVPTARDARPFMSLIEKPMTGDALVGFVQRTLDRWKAPSRRPAS